MTDLAGRYMAAEAAYNNGDAAPFAAMFADEISLNGARLTHHELHAILAANVAAGMRFRTIGMSTFGEFLIVHGELTLPEGGAIAQVGVLRFAPSGLSTEFAMLQGALP
jgi:hypothetical protein